MKNDLHDDLHDTVRAACLWLPETDEVSSHDSPNFRVRRIGMWARRADRRFTLCYSVGGDPAEFAALAEQSYRHFARKRMLTRLPPHKAEVPTRQRRRHGSTLQA